MALKKTTGVCAVLALAATIVVSAASPVLADEPLTVPGEIIVGFEDNVSEGERNEILATVSAVEEKEFEAIESELVEVDPETVESALPKLEDDPRVEYAEPNFIVSADDHTLGPNPPNDPAFHELWGLDNFGQTVNGSTGTPDADIDAEEAWSKTTGSASVVVGVIDTGVAFNHPDLAGAKWVNTDEVPGNGIDDDSNGYVDDINGWDFVNNDNNPFDDNGHGTHVAGTIAGVGNNSIGVTGVNWTAQVMALKFLGAGGSGSTSDAIEAILYASHASSHADITNNSWGGGGFSQALLNAITTADASNSLFVAAAGNDGVNADTNPHYPSAYDAPNVISVAATTSTDARASFSNYGLNTVDLGAPGANIYSTYPGNTYRYLSGTSMATPHVAGAAALVKSKFPSATDVGMKALLLSTADPNTALRTGGPTPVATGGRLNVNNAVSCSGPSVSIDQPGSDFVADTGEPLPIKVFATNCGSSEGLTVTATANESPISPALADPDGDGLYTGTYIPSVPGNLTIEVEGTAGATTVMDSVMGAVAANYVMEDSTFNWVDASSGTSVGLSDDSSATVSLPFAFSLYDESFSSVKISSNGYLVFGSSAATAYANASLPDSAAPNGVVAPFWDDLNPGAGGSVRHATVGTAPTRRFVVAWSGVPHYSTSGNATFEVVLEEATNDIYFQYQDVDFGNATYNQGSSASVGLENSSGTRGRQFSHNQASLSALKAIRFSMSPGDTGPTITTTSLADGTVDQTYTEAVEASGGTPPYSWSLVSGDVPPGLDLNASTGEITGTPTATGTYDLVVQVADATSPTALTDAKPLSIDVGTGVVITTSGLEAGTVDQPYNQSLAATGGTTPYTWSLASGALPPGVSLNASTGSISGTPTTPGTYDFTARVTDGADPARSDTHALSIAIAPKPLQITTTSLPGGTAGQPYSQTLQAGGGTTPYTYSLASGSLPPGLNLNASTGAISGTPSSAGTYIFTAQVTDAGAPVQMDTQPLSIAVAAQPAAPLTIGTTSLPEGRRGQSYSSTLQATGGTTPYAWSIVTGSLPRGLTLNGTTGQISGTPNKKGTFTFTAKVTDSSSPAQSATKQLSIKIR